MRNIKLNDQETATAVEGGREFWRAVLLAGGFAAVPRWTLDPTPGVGDHELRIPDELTAALRRLANDLAVSLSSVLLAAHPILADLAEPLRREHTLELLTSSSGRN